MVTKIFASATKVFAKATICFLRLAAPDQKRGAKAKQATGTSIENSLRGQVQTGCRKPHTEDSI